MDQVLAARMSREIVGSDVGGWRAVEYRGAGKSALVLRAHRGGQEAALKVFDPDLVTKYGEATQLARIEREKRLIGKSHPHLVRIFDGGKCATTGHLFVAMEFIPAKDLAQVLTAVPRDKIWPLIAQLAHAARFLHDQGLAHRDIKPSNIAVSDDFQHLTLLDLGVLRPFGETGLTDTEGQQFVGTLQYSSPEFLFRNEKDDPDGWLALAFYQIGAVLHDLIKKKPIFDEFQIPYARMVDAVKHTAPDLHVPGADPDLVALAQSCLVKDPATRLTLVTWDSFANPPRPTDVASIRDRVRRRVATSAAAVKEEPVLLSRGLVLNELHGRISTVIRDECLSHVDVFPPVEIHDYSPPDVESIAFRAAFPAAREKSLTVPLALLFRIRLLDLAAQIVEVNVGAAVSSDVRRFPIEAFSADRVLYRGPVGNEKLKAQIDYALYAAVEAAIGHSSLKYDQTQALNIIVSESAE